MSEIRATKEDLEKLFKIVKLDPKRKERYPDKPHMWYKRKAQAATKMGLSRTTIDKYLQQYAVMPEKPKKTIPRYFEEFEQSECAKKIRSMYYDAKIKGLSRTGENYFSILRSAWKAKNKKDPLTFDLQDYLFFWGTSTQAPYPPFVDPMTNTIAFDKAVALRQTMVLGYAKDLINDPRFTTKGLKRPAGLKKHWYLEPEEIIKVVNCINEPDTLLLMYLGVLFGGRFSALSKLKVGDFHRQAQFAMLYEPKVDMLVEKDLFDFSLEFVWQYIVDFDIKDRLFHWGLDEFNKRFTKASIEAGLPKEKIMTSHMLKHTCITQMSLHGVDIDVISEYVGTDTETIMDFYRGGGRDKIRTQILALPRQQRTWKDFVQSIHPYFVQRYNYVKAFAKKVDGFQRGA